MPLLPTSLLESTIVPNEDDLHITERNIIFGIVCVLAILCVIKLERYIYGRYYHDKEE